ncbi:MAG: DUF3073 domain-containing protein [Actinomycetes bacterium]
MGRGRAKAKQTKVARELKYSSGALDINALTAELGGSGHHDHAAHGSDRGAESSEDSDDGRGDDQARY